MAGRVEKMERGKQFVCVAGKNDIAVNVLGHLLEFGGDYALGVVCNRTETGVNSFQKSLRWFAKKEGIREYALEDLYGMGSLVFLSLEFDRLVKPGKFKDARLYNIHFSLLPQYKGMYTSALPILNGESQSGVTLHRIDAGIDTGEIIDQEAFPIGGMDCREVYLSYIRHGTEVVARNIRAILEGRERAYPQPVSGSTYYPRGCIDYGAVKIDLNQTAEGVSRQIRAFGFREYQLPEVNGKPIIDSSFTGTRSGRKPGTVLMENGNACIVSTVDYNIILYYDRLEELLGYCRHGDLGGVHDVCAVKKHVNAAGCHGWTPLMVSAYYNQIETVKYLLAQGADIHAVNHNGTTLLMYAKEAYRKTGDDTLFSLFLSLGADMSVKDYNGLTLQDYCAKEGIRNIGPYRVCTP